ncbi:MAG: hypothetical protein KGJ86_00300 [Chloroflexota bacterium]|nr:hypothetical protein [Chloroflexota bacterium]
MGEAVAAITILGLVLVGLGVMVGRIRPGDAFGRIGAFLLLLLFAPLIATLLRSTVAAVLKPALVILALVVVVTVMLRALVRLFS